MSYVELGKNLENDFEYNNCVKDADLYIRMDFLRKIYSILAVQLGVTCVTGIVLFAFKDHLSLFLSQHPAILFVLVIASFVNLGVMLYKRYESPINLVLLMSFTLVESFLVGLAVIHFNAAVVLQALVITSAIVIGLTAYTFQSKRDFSTWGVCLGALMLALFVGALTNFIFASPVLHLALSIGGAFLFACLMVYDTQMIMKRFSAEEYVVAAITLYLDILNLFLYILRILQAANNNN